MTDNPKKMLTEFLGECWHDFSDLYNDDIEPNVWACRLCGELTDTRWIYRTFFTGNDLIAVKDALVREGLWREFFLYTFKIYAHTPEAQFLLHSAHGVSADNHVAWLFRPTDEQGEAHFCRLVAEFIDHNKK